MTLRLTDYDDFSSVSSDEMESAEPDEQTQTLNQADLPTVFKHFQGFFSADYFEPLLKVLKPIIEAKMTKYSTRKRRSCIFSLRPSYIDADEDSYTYNHLPPIIEELKQKIETLTGERFDYVLAHIYYDGKAGIGYHSDKEAMSSQIASVSFGATRKFRLRRVGETSSWDYEFKLRSGDLFMMYVGCQEKYMHSVPVESAILKPRINLTFRKYE